MTQNYRYPKYFTIPLLSKEFNISTTRIEIDIRSGIINKFQIEYMNTKAKLAAKKRIDRILPELNQFIRDHIDDGPATIIANYNPNEFKSNDASLGILKKDLNSKSLFELWLKTYNIDIHSIKVVIPCDEVLRYVKYIKKESDILSTDPTITAFDINEYIIKKRKAKGCEKKVCRKCKDNKCRNQLAHELFMNYGKNTKYGITLCEIGIAMGYTEPTWAIDKDDEAQKKLQDEQVDIIKQAVSRWKSEHSKKDI